jgi:hypothetical protein
MIPNQLLLSFLLPLLLNYPVFAQDSCTVPKIKNQNKRPRRKQRGIATLFLTFHAPQGAGNLPVILLNHLILNLLKNTSKTVGQSPSNY